MRSTTLVVVTLVSLAGCAAAAPPEPPVVRVTRVAGDLVPLNGSLVSGTVRAAVEDSRLSILVDVDGLEPGQLHAQHLHGLLGDASGAACPTVEDDADGDQVLSADEAEAVTGPPLFPLEPFPLPSDESTLRYEASIPVDRERLGPLPLRVVMLRGLTLDGSYQPLLPVACAELQSVQGVAPPRIE